MGNKINAFCDCSLGSPYQPVDEKVKHKKPKPIVEFDRRASKMSDNFSYFERFSSKDVTEIFEFTNVIGKGHYGIVY